MMNERQISFSWEKRDYTGYIEKEYENSFLIVVSEPSRDMEEKYTNRMIVSKKACEFFTK